MLASILGIGLLFGAAFMVAIRVLLYMGLFVYQTINKNYVALRGAGNAGRYIIGPQKAHKQKLG